MFRPFPTEEIAKSLSKLKAVAVLDKADSVNGAGGALYTDVTSSMYVNKANVPMVNYIYGIGGRDTTSYDIEGVFNDLSEIAKTGNVENPYRYFGVRREEK
jgi:pyruvate ferredoxin oxidoreductase alpha subunit